MQSETQSEGMEMAPLCRLSSMAYLGVELEDIVTNTSSATLLAV